MARRWTVAPAIVRRAQVRSPFQHLARNYDLRLAGVVAFVLASAARIFRNAAGLRRVALVLGRVPILGPLPDIADHVVDAVPVRRKRRHRRRTVEAVLTKIVAGKITLPGIGHVKTLKREFLAPGEFGIV